MELEPRAERGAQGPRLSYAPGLDGLRAAALLAIMVFHDGFTWLPGGFYSVDAFFVLSGYLITSLLVVERRGTGTILLGRFWARRARRLLPALFALVAGLAILHLAWPSVLPWTDAVPDAAATLGYFANWHFIASNAGYFAGTTSPSPLLHTWTLAIEEQFYLVWPLVVVLVLGVRRNKAKGDDLSSGYDRRRLLALGLISAAGALASATWMWHLTPDGAISPHAYYGTDSRAQSILVGAVLAIVLELYKSRTTTVHTHKVPTRRVQWIGTLSGIAGVAALAWIWHSVTQYSLLAFHGGFLLASAASAAIVAGAVLAPRSPVSWVLSLRPLREMGKISYGGYLWYWPVTLVVTSGRTHLGNWPLLGVQVAATVGLAALSSRFIELPIRRGTLPGWRALLGAPAAAGLALGMVAVSASAVPASALSPIPRLVQSSAGPPVRVLLVGDSMAGSLGAALEPVAGRYGVEIINEGHPGCGASSDAKFRFLLYIDSPEKPCELGQPNALIDQWRVWVDEYRPQVVVYLARVDLMNQELGGSWTWIGQSSFDHFYSDQLSKGVAVLGSQGARVVLMTSPYYDSTIQAGGVSVPEDQPDRVKIDDQILSTVAFSHPDVTVYPLGKLVTPDGHYQQDVSGVNVRCNDGVHFSAASGEVLAPEILPEVIKLGRSVHVATIADPPSLPPPVPTWYDQLQCGE